MVEIEVDPKVHAALRSAFPSPPNSATRALSKYVAQLQAMLIDALMQGQSPLELKLALFSISLHQLANKGGQIGKKKQRVHAWLNDHGLPLVEPVVIGSNLSGMSSKVKFTDLVTLTMPQVAQPANTTVIDGTVIENNLLATTAKANAALLKQLYPDFDDCVMSEKLEEVFDAVDVDLASLENYIKWLRDDAKLINANKRKHYLFQAHIILSVAKDKGGKYYQRKKPSEFGRMYYAGTSVQNVNKELRRAMLGDCWEYDIRSSVIAWKMGYAKECILALNLNHDTRITFKHTLSYLEDKVGFMKTLQYLVFKNDSPLAPALQTDVLKQAFTALSFGARKTTNGWMDSNGSWTKPAIVEIFRVKEERERFLGDLGVNGFIQEQSLLDTFLFDALKKERPDLLKLPYLQTQGGNASKSKCVAFLYQHEETTVMDIVRAAVVAHGKTVLASIHDAIIVKQRLGDELKQEIEFCMQEQTANPYWHLGAKELKRYASVSKEARLEESLHKQRMQKFEAIAAGYKSPLTNSSNP